jgi:enoyl-[acyl-carrier-protein] reductase (NADH)
MAPIILITGANRGIGFCIAQVLARQKAGSTILVTARTQSSASEAVKKLASDAHGTLEPMTLDVTSDDSMHALVAMIKEKHGRLDGKHTIKMAMLPHTTLTHPHSSHQQCRYRSCSRSGPLRLSSGLRLSLEHECYLGRPLDLTSDASAA